ncbi:MAG: hypothetical protein V3S01_01335 [Dehalococcoidia bacterium]
MAVVDTGLAVGAVWPAGIHRRGTGDERFIHTFQQQTVGGVCISTRSDYTVLFRSTGLGKAELVGEITGIKTQGDYLIMEIQTTEPVRWKIRGAVSCKDLKTLIKVAFRLSVLLFFMRVAAWFREPRSPGDF